MKSWSVRPRPFICESNEILTWIFFFGTTSTKTDYTSQMSSFANFSFVGLKFKLTQTILFLEISTKFMNFTNGTYVHTDEWPTRVSLTCVNSTTAISANVSLWIQMFLYFSIVFLTCFEVSNLQFCILQLFGLLNMRIFLVHITPPSGNTVRTLRNINSLWWR